MRLVYVCGGDCSVFESQVMELLDYYQQTGIDVTLFEGYSTEDERVSLEKKIMRHASIRVMWFKTYPFYPIFLSASIKAFQEALYKMHDLSDVRFHVRGGLQGYLVCEALRKDNIELPVLVDIRGVRVEEMKYLIVRQTGFRQLLSKIQMAYFERMTHKFYMGNYPQVTITSVSPVINDYLHSSYAECLYPMYVHPNIAGLAFEYSEEQRHQIRNEFHIGLSEVVAICATGGNGLWQKDYQVIEHLVKQGIKVINLSKEKIDIEGVISTIVPFSQMPAMLSAADIAVLWRDDTFINQSASPSKFSEFAAMGVYVIHNGSVAVATQYLRECGAGLIVRDMAEICNLPSLQYLHNHRAKWIADGKKAFGVMEIGYSLLRCLRIEV